MDLKSPPNWLIALALVTLAGAYTYSIVTGAPILFWGKEFGVRQEDSARRTVRATETWEIKGDIDRSDWTGTWRVSNATEGFVCTEPWIDGSREAQCTAIYQDQRVAVRKYSIEPLGNTNICLYFGSRSGNRIKGEQVCENSLSVFSWSAVVVE